jgi:SAM-dependent methyltransferase
MAADPYSTDALYYDIIHGEIRDDIGLWLSFAGRTDRPVLEVGTGTGRIGIELALSGHTVTGIDPSRAMLERARRKAEEQGTDITLLEGGILDLHLQAGSFGFVLIPADVFLYCRSTEEQLDTLRALGELLHFNGILAIDLPGPQYTLDPASNGQPILVHTGSLEDGTRFEAWQVHEDDLAEQTRTLRVSYEWTNSEGVLHRRSSDHTLRYPHRYEMEHLLQLAGLVQLDVFGDYELGPLTSESNRMIFTARRAEG